MRDNVVVRLFLRFGSPVVELCPVEVTKKSDSHGCRRLEGTLGSLLGVEICLRVGPEVSLLGVERDNCYGDLGLHL